MRANRKFEAAIPNQEDARIKQLQRQHHGTKLQEAIAYKPEGAVESPIWRPMLHQRIGRPQFADAFPIKVRGLAAGTLQVQAAQENGGIRLADLINAQRMLGMHVDIEKAEKVRDHWHELQVKAHAKQMEGLHGGQFIEVKEKPKYNAVAWFDDNLQVMYNDEVIGAGHSRRAFNCDYRKGKKEFIIKEANSKGGRLSNMFEYAIYKAAMDNKLRWRHILPEFAAISECGYFLLIEKCQIAARIHPQNQEEEEYKRKARKKVYNIFKCDMHSDNWGYAAIDKRPVVLDMAVDDTDFYKLALKANANVYDINKIFYKSGYTADKIKSVYERAA